MGIQDSSIAASAVPAVAVPAPPLGDLARKARLAIVWTTSVHAARDVVQFGLMLVLVRLLPVSAYGEFNMVNAIIGFMVAFSFREFVAHTVVVRDDAAVNYQHHFTAGLVIQGSLFLLANLVGVALRWFPDYSPVAPMLHVMSIAFLIDLPSELRTKMLERSLDWQRLRGIELTALGLSAAGAVALGLAGAGAYALLVPALVYPTLLMLDLLLVQRWRPTFEWSREDFEASKAFGLTRIGSAGILTLANLLESSAMVRIAGFAGLGVFGRAIGLSQLACHRAAYLLMASVFPVITRLESGSEAYRRAGGLALRAVTWVAFPSAVALSILAAPLVQMLYGERWMEVAPLLPWAMLAAAVLATVHVTYYLLLGNQQQRTCLTADVWRLFGVSAALAAALPFGVIVYLQTLVAVHTITLIFVTRALIASNGLERRDFIAAVGPAAIAALAGGGMASVTLGALGPDVAGTPRLLTGALVFGVTYLCALRVLFPAALREVIAQLPYAGRLNRTLGFA